MKRLVYFEIPSANPKRATWFYEDTIWLDTSKPEFYKDSNKDTWISQRNESGDITESLDIVNVANLDEYINKAMINWWASTRPKNQTVRVWLFTYYGDAEWNIYWMFEMEI